MKYDSTPCEIPQAALQALNQTDCLIEGRLTIVL